MERFYCYSSSRDERPDTPGRATWGSTRVSQEAEAGVRGKHRTQSPLCISWIRQGRPGVTAEDWLP